MSAITPGTLDVWRIDLERHRELDLLTEDERQRADRFLREEKRLEFTVARSALRRILGQAFDVEPLELRFELGEHGRPELAGVDGAQFNLSHSAGLALVAVADVPQLGVDVEERREGRPLGRLAQRFFSTQEVREYLSFPPAEMVETFYRGWTRKEAYLKAWGTGLTFSSRGFSLSLDRDGSRVLETGMPGDDGRGWNFHDLEVGAGHAACVCWRGGSIDLTPRLREFTSSVGADIG